MHALNAAALLCYADCVPVIIVSPTGRFAVVHAGWRGVDNLISVKAVRSMAYADEALLGADAASTYNVYIGPHIGPECFETFRVSIRGEVRFRRQLYRFGGRASNPT